MSFQIARKVAHDTTPARQSSLLIVNPHNSMCSGKACPCPLGIAVQTNYGYIALCALCMLPGVTVLPWGMAHLLMIAAGFPTTRHELLGIAHCMHTACEFKSPSAIRHIFMAHCNIVTMHNAVRKYYINGDNRPLSEYFRCAASLRVLRVV
jgi:hypothetical protein